MPFIVPVAVGVIAGLVLAVVGTYVYDLLKPKLFPPNPSRRRLLAIVLFTIPVLLALIWASYQVGIGPPPEPEEPAQTQEPTIERITLVPIPTITPMATSDRIYLDDFSSVSSGWDQINDDTGTSGYDIGIGKYFVDPAPRRLFLANWERVGNIIDNAVIEADILGPFAQPGVKQGLSFGWHPDWIGTHAFLVDSEGNCRVWEHDGKSWVEKTSIHLDSFDNEATYHTLRVAIRNGSLAGYIDGQFCINYRMHGYTPGFVGVVASSGPSDQPGKLLFDEYRVYHP